MRMDKEFRHVRVNVLDEICKRRTYLQSQIDTRFTFTKLKAKKTKINFLTSREDGFNN